MTVFDELKDVYKRQFTGNTGMTERQIYQYLKDYDYAHPDMTHIWIAVDTNYPVQGDAFYNRCV